MKEKAGQLDLLEYLSGLQRPKTKTLTCNQTGCYTEVTLTWDDESGIYVGNRCCEKCKKAYRFRYAESL